MRSVKGWSCEIKRIFTGSRLYLSIIGVAAALFFSLESHGLELSVTDTYFSATLGSGVVLSYIFAAYVYGTVFCQELEHFYLYYELMRENLKHYVIKKVVLIFASSVFVIMAGTMSFALICRISLPWVIPGKGGYHILVQGLYGGLLESGHFLWYLLLNSIHRGFLAGLLTLAASLFSLFITNRVMVLCFPVLLLEVLYLFPGAYQIPEMFSGAFLGDHSLWTALAVPLLASGAGLFICGIIIYKVLQSRL